MALPANVSYGTVTGVFLQAVADTPSDPDRIPDGLPVTDLSVTFTASISPAVVRDMSATPPVMIVVQPVTATVDSSGVLRGADGAAGVTLLSNSNTSLDPHGWVWKVSLSSATFPQVSFSFNLDGGQTIDLATVVRVPSVPAATLSAWLQAVQDARDARDAAVAAAAAVQSGGGGMDSALQYTQASPSSQWTIGHSFGRRPDVDIYLTTGELVITDVAASTTQVVVTFPTPTAGYAVLT